MLEVDPDHAVWQGGDASMKRLWILLAIVLTFGFTVLGWVGSRIYQDMPPIPERIVTTDGQVVAPEGSVRSGQAVWQTLGCPGSA